MSLAYVSYLLTVFREMNLPNAPRYFTGRDNDTETERLREYGSFSGEVGDLVMKVCSDLL